MKISNGVDRLQQSINRANTTSGYYRKKKDDESVRPSDIKSANASDACLSGLILYLGASWESFVEDCFLHVAEKIITVEY